MKLNGIFDSLSRYSHLAFFIAMPLTSNEYNLLLNSTNAFLVGAISLDFSTTIPFFKSYLITPSKLLKYKKLSSLYKFDHY